MSEKLKAPCLQDWIARYGSYVDIDWKAWHDANAKYQAERSKQIVGDADRGRKEKAA